MTNNLDTPQGAPREKKPHYDTNLFEGSLWMIGITMVLFFIPAVNGLIGGYVGGYRVGTVKRAITAAVLPAIISALGLWLLLMAMGKPGFGFVGGLTVGALIIISEFGLFVGAFFGGLTRERFHPVQPPRSPQPL